MLSVMILAQKVLQWAIFEGAVRASDKLSLVSKLLCFQNDCSVCCLKVINGIFNGIVGSVTVSPVG
jgi:hypothetical protein